jgi:hypothetical protein
LRHGKRRRVLDAPRVKRRLGTSGGRSLLRAGARSATVRQQCRAPRQGAAPWVAGQVRQERARPIVDFGVWRHGGRSGRAVFEARAPPEPCPTQGSGLATSTNGWHPCTAADAADWRIGARIDRKVSSIDRFDALFWCRLVHQPARRPWRLLGRSYSPQRCGASLAARLARVGELLPVKPAGVGDRARSRRRGRDARPLMSHPDRPCTRVRTRSASHLLARFVLPVRGLGDETVRDPETEGRRACCVPPADTDGLSYDALGSLGPRGLLHYEGCDGVAGRADRGARGGELAVGGGALGGA